MIVVIQVVQLLHILCCSCLFLGNKICWIVDNQEQAQLLRKNDYVVYNSVMEFANLGEEKGQTITNFRVAKSEDAEAILRLLRTAVYTHFHVDWCLPGDWIGAPGFVVLPQEKWLNKNNPTAKLFPNRINIDACLAATADPPPAAWVRVAAFRKKETAAEILAQLLGFIRPSLRAQGVSQLAWLATEEWPQPLLPKLGFYVGSQIDTYVKEDRQLPSLPNVPDLTITSVETADFNALAQLEEVAFAPIWRLSTSALAAAYPQSFSFDVARLAGEIVGYQLSARATDGVHLARLTVHPQKQGLGLGSALLGHTLAGFYAQSIQTVSLNTQVENLASQRLYEKFGFVASQQRLPIWILDIAQ